MDYHWLVTQGTNEAVSLFTANNSMLLGALVSAIFTVLKIRAKKTKTTDDDERIDRLEKAFRKRFMSPLGE